MAPVRRRHPPPPVRPRILVTIGRELPDRGDRLRLSARCADALLSERATSLLIPPGLDASAVEDLVSAADGLLLPGGVDPHPRSFGEAKHAMTQADDELDELEFLAVAAARRAGLPILGICRGCQVLNVAFGGSLIQHLDTTPIDHKPDLPLERLVHHASLQDGTRLRALAGCAELPVNSWHHQGIGRLGGGLRVAAVAEDGVIEAIESTEPDEWILGVQYHPEELMGMEAHRAVIAGFVAAARQRGRVSPARRAATEPTR